MFTMAWVRLLVTRKVKPVRPSLRQPQDRPPAAQEEQYPGGAGGLGQHRRQGGALHAHAAGIDEHRVQDDVQHRPDDHGHHADAGEALGVDERVHAQADEHRDGADHIDPEIAQRGGQGRIVAAQQAQHCGGGKVHADGQDRAHEQEHGKGSAHDPLRFVVPVFAPGDGRQRGAAGAEQVGKGPDQGDQRETDAQPRQRNGAAARHMADIHPVHDVVKHMNKLGQHHRQAESENVSRYFSLGKIAFTCRHPEIPFTLVLIVCNPTTNPEKPKGLSLFSGREEGFSFPAFVL